MELLRDGVQHRGDASTPPEMQHNGRRGNQTRNIPTASLVTPDRHMCTQTARNSNSARQPLYQTCIDAPNAL